MKQSTRLIKSDCGGCARITHMPMSYAMNGWDEKPATLPKRSTVRSASGHSVAQKGAWHETVYSSHQV